jgi:hypothetical protein
MIFRVCPNTRRVLPLLAGIKPNRLGRNSITGTRGIKYGRWGGRFIRPAIFLDIIIIVIKKIPLK